VDERPSGPGCERGLDVGYPSKDGKPITAQDFVIEDHLTVLGTLAGHKIVQVIYTIHACTGNGPAFQWKTLLAQEGASPDFREIYALQIDGDGLFQPFKPAAIYGTGPNAILGTYDPDTGNGGGCSDGYWWFDKEGSHPVDFAPLDRAIAKVLPKGTGFNSRCWALHPKTEKLQRWVQRTDATCHACGGEGEVFAEYRIENDAAIPVSVRFEPGQ
jgi:hypothetical protein